MFQLNNTLYTFNDSTWADFFKELGYTPPRRQALADTRLDSVYKETKAKVEEVAKDAELGLFTDESTDVSLNRLANYSFLLLDKTLFY